MPFDTKCSMKNGDCVGNNSPFTLSSTQIDIAMFIYLKWDYFLKIEMEECLNRTRKHFCFIFLLNSMIIIMLMREDVLHNPYQVEQHYVN